MSQSSTSSTNSRKRRATSCSSSPSSIVWDSQKKRYSRLSLKKAAYDNWIPESQKLKEMNKLSQEGSIDSYTFSLSTSSSRKNSNDKVPNFVAFAAKYGINPVTAKKHFSILTTKPKVHLVLIDPKRLVFQEPFDLSQITVAHQNNRGPSPILGSRLKRKNKHMKIKQEPCDFSVTNTFNNTNGVQLPVRTTQNIQAFFESIERQEVDGETTTAFEEPSQQRLPLMVTNPFSKTLNKNPTSYQEKNYSSSDSTEVFAGFKTNLQCEASYTKEQKKKDTIQELSKEKLKQIKAFNTSQSGNDICSDSVIDSMSVNFNPNFEFEDVNINENTENNNLLPFGSSILLKENIKSSVNNNQSLRNQYEFKSNLSCEKQNKADNFNQLSKQEETKVDNDYESDDLNQSFSMDLLNYSPNFDCSSPEKVLRRNSLRSDENFKSRGVPKIKSIDTLSKNLIFIPTNQDEENNILLLSRTDTEVITCNAEKSVSENLLPITSKVGVQEKQIQNIKATESTNQNESFDNLCNIIVQMTDEKDAVSEKKNINGDLNFKKDKETNQESNVDLSTKVDSETSRSTSPILDRRSRSRMSKLHKKKKSLSSLNTPLSFPRTTPYSRNMDPRLNKSISPLKSARKNEEPWDAFVTPDTISLMEEKDDFLMEKIIDPRLRKRKERQDAEKALKLVDAFSSSDILDPSQKEASPTKKIKMSAFDRLGAKTKSRSPSPIKKSDFLSNELKNIVKEARKLGSDDEEVLDLHSMDVFSDDDSDTEQPRTRHNKFTSERVSGGETIGDSVNLNPVIQGLTTVNNKFKPNSVNAIGLNNAHKDLNRSSLSVVNETKRNTPHILGLNSKTLTNNKENNISSRLGPPINTSVIGSRLKPPPSVGIKNKLELNVNKPIISNLRMTESSSTIPIAARLGTVKSRINPKVIDTSKKDPKVGCSVENSSNHQEETYASSVETGSIVQSSKFDHTSMLESRPEIPKLGLQNCKDTSFFRNYCFKMLTKGFCGNENKGCSYSHQVTFLQRLIKQKKAELLTKILDFAIEREFGFFLQKVWSSILPNLKEDSFNYFEKLYQGKFYSKSIIHDLLEYCLQSKIYSIESFSKKIALIIKTNDKQLVKDVCQEIKPRLREGFCWETIKTMCLKAHPPKDMIELSILECINRKKSAAHIKEIHELIKSKMSPREKNELDQDLLQKFYNHVQRNNTSPLDREALVTIPLGGGNYSCGVKAVGNPSSNQVTRKLINTTHSEQNLRPQVSFKHHEHDSELELVAPKKGEIINFEAFNPHRIEIKEPLDYTNPLYKQQFWKLSLAVDSINEGLKHEDYAHVWKTMDEFSKENVEDELLMRAYYHNLCRNVKNSERHLSEIIRIAVSNRWSTLRKSIEILFDISVLALIELASQGLWIMALQLLESVKIIKPDENRTVFILISAEIYLANNDPFEALYLLQRTRIIRTNRDEWLVKDSTREDEKHRNKIVFILLKALSFFDPEKSVYLFKFLMEDQYISYYPIDLPSYLDKLTLLLLLQEKYESVVDLCRIVMNNDLTFKKETYHEIICRTLSFDEIFANQVLDYATHLGYYTDIKIRQGFTTLIIDINLSEEELYMILKRLISKLMFNVGAAIDHLKPNQIKVILIFEDIPVDTRLYKDEIPLISKDKYKNIRNLVHTVLATRFTPPIRIGRTGKTKDKFCKLVSRTIVDHLKQWI